MDKHDWLVTVLTLGLMAILASSDSSGGTGKGVSSSARHTTSQTGSRPTKTRGECLRQVIDYWAAIPIPDDVKPLVAEVREYHDRQEDIDSDYVVPEMSKSCKRLTKAVFHKLKRSVRCWRNPQLMRTTNKYQTVYEILTEPLPRAEMAYITALIEA